MQRDSSLSEEMGERLIYRSLIDQVILVGLDRHCQIRSDSHQLRWITSLRIAGRKQYQAEGGGSGEQAGTKFVEIGNNLFLQLYFCEKDQRPVTKLKSCLRTTCNSDQLLAFPIGVTFQEGLYFERSGEGRRIIEDVEMVEVSGDHDLELPEEESYEVIRLPAACQTVPEENSSNEQLMEKTRYLLIKTLDLDDHGTISQYFQPTVTLKHPFKNSTLFIDYANFPDFVFPEGILLSSEVLGSGYQVLSFILTQEDSSRLFVNCLKFKQRLQREVVDSLPSNCVDKHLHEKKVLFADRAFCIVSRYCYTDFFHGLLQEVFRKYLTLHNELEIRWRHEVKSDGCIPCVQEDIRFDQLAQEFIRSYGKGLMLAERELNEVQYMKDSIKIQMEWFEQRFIFPQPIQDAASHFSPRAVHCLFSVLSVDRVAEVFLSLLQEKKIFFISDSQIVLGYVIESLLSFLYPLKWEHVILPILPQKLLQLLDAPVPLIAGIPTSLASDDLICNAKDTTVVFLDCNQVISRDSPFEVKDINHLKEAVKRLRTYEIYSKDHVFRMLLLKQQFFLFRVHEKESESIFSAEHIKHIFFEAMLLLLQNYNVYYGRRETTSNTSHSIQGEFNFKKDYRIQEYVRSHPKSLQRFMRKFTQCTHFINFIYKYAGTSHNPHKAFIDGALNNQRLSQSPVKYPPFRLSEQPNRNGLQVNTLRKKVSLQHHHNTTWSPPPKKSEEISTNYSRNLDRYSLKLEDVELQKEQSVGHAEADRKTKGGQICEAITKAMTNAAHTKQNVIIWTQARVARLKRIFGGKYDKEGKEADMREEGEREKQCRQGTEGKQGRVNKQGKQFRQSKESKESKEQ